VLLGAYDGGEPATLEGIDRLEQRIGVTLPLIQLYTAWGDTPDEQFPGRVAAAIRDFGSVPLISWEPWLTDFESALHPNIALRDVRENHGMAAVARGEYDFYIDAWAVDAARFGHPIFVRLGHEMNDPYRYPWGPQNGNRPDDFIAAWRHVHLIFQKMNATNVLWVWSPHISMPWFEYYYPGADLVDWIGIGGLNYGTVASWSRWWSFHQILEKAYPALLKLDKPIMVCEFGTLAAGGNEYEWYRQAFYHIDHTYARGIKAVIFFNQENDITMSTNPLNWSLLPDDRAATLVSQSLAAHSAL
jgi:hypothetical protein